MVDPSLFISESRKIVKMFSVVGLNESKISKYREEDNTMRFVQNIDIIKKNIKINSGKIEPNDNEKWYIFINPRLLLNKNDSYWMRIEYSKKYECPVTSLRVIECDYESPEYLVCCCINS